MRHIQYGNKKIAYTVKKSRRTKTVAIQMQPNAQILILIPPFLNDEIVKKIVLKRASWIIQKQEKLKKISSSVPKKELVSGETFPYLGRQYRLKILKSAVEKSECKLLNGRLYIEINKRFKGKIATKLILEALLNWYIEHAKIKIADRVQKYSKLTGKEPKKVLIRSQEKRWGSCSRAGILRINWKITMAPISVLDYVVIHELCHLTHPNHSPEFWRKVESIIPDYKKKKDWLKENSLLLSELMNSSF